MSTLKHETEASSIQKMLASAIWLGMQFSSKPMQGTLFDISNREILEAMQQLNVNTAFFLQLIRSELSMQDVLPLMQEINSQAKDRGMPV